MYLQQNVGFKTIKIVCVCASAFYSIQIVHGKSAPHQKCENANSVWNETEIGLKFQLKCAKANYGNGCKGIFGRENKHIFSMPDLLSRPYFSH